MKKIVTIFTLMCLASSAFAQSSPQTSCDLNNQTAQASTCNSFPDIKISNDIWIGEPASKFRNLKSVQSKKYMVASAHILASNAGAEILAKGGNAIDAAIATELVLNVVEPHSSGIGGGGFLMFYDAKNKQSIYFNGRERAPKDAYETMFLNKDGSAKKFAEVVKGGLSVATPGLLKIMKESHEKYGKLPWKDLFEPAIKAAEDGFKIDERLHALASTITYIRAFEQTAKLYTNPDGSAKAVGEIVKNPEMAKTLKTLANEGIEPFYNGKIANDIVKTVKSSPINPGIINLSDLKNYHSKSGDPVCTSYRKKYKICSMPLPSSGGITLLQILGILENFDLTKYKPNSPKTIHLIAEATKLAYADRNEYIGDSSDVPIAKMLNKNYLKSRAQTIDPARAQKFEAGKFPVISNDNVKDSYNNQEPPSTTHLSVIDPEGNAVSFTSSIEYFFGSALSVDGFLLNNHMTDFAFVPEANGKKVANRIEPFKQPRSSMSPTFVFDNNDKLIMVVGSPGGPRIIQHVLKTIIATLDWDFNIQQAISMPNFIALGGTLELEKGTKITKLDSSLKKLGHQVKITEITSGIHAITIDNYGVLRGGADPRRNGVVIGK